MCVCVCVYMYIFNYLAKFTGVERRFATAYIYTWCMKFVAMIHRSFQHVAQMDSWKKGTDHRILARRRAAECFMYDLFQKCVPSSLCPSFRPAYKCFLMTATIHSCYFMRIKFCVQVVLFLYIGVLLSSLWGAACNGWMNFSWACAII